jgi:hypothetical protein
VRVSELVFGGAPIGGLYAPVSDDQAAAALEAAWAAGIRAFDTALTAAVPAELFDDLAAGHLIPIAVDPP